MEQKSQNIESTETIKALHFLAHLCDDTVSKLLRHSLNQSQLLVKSNMREFSDEICLRHFQNMKQNLADQQERRQKAKKISNRKKGRGAGAVSVKQTRFTGGNTWWSDTEAIVHYAIYLILREDESSQGDAKNTADKRVQIASGLLLRLM
jgi:hypothetical protein